METKTCATCGETKSVDAFDLKGIGPTGTKYYRNLCKPCYNGTRRSRYRVDPNLRQQKREGAARWRREYPAKYQESRRRYRRANRQKIYQQNKEAGYSKRWHKQNREHMRAYTRAYNNRPEVRKRIQERDRRRHEQPARRAYTRARTNRWRKEHVEEFRAQAFVWKTTRNARKANAPKIERVYRTKIIKRDKSTCYICKQVVLASDIHLDHVIPLSRGGEHSYANIRVTCRSCNLKKHNKLPEELGIVVEPLC